MNEHVAETAYDGATSIAASLHERRTDLAGGRAFFEACRDGDVEGLRAAIRFIGANTIGGWENAFLRVAALRGVSPGISAAFTAAWVSNATILLHVHRQSAVIRALRMLLPPYAGEDDPVRLYRGVPWQEQRRRVYGLSWTSDVSVAERFATDFGRTNREGGALVEDDVPAAAVVSAFMVEADGSRHWEFLVDSRSIRFARVLRRYGEVDPLGWKRSCRGKP